MGNNIIKISDLTSAKKTDSENTYQANLSDTKEKFANAKEIANKELNSLSIVLEEFGKKANSRYAICDLINFDKMLNNWFSAIVENTIRPMIDGGQYVSTNPEIDFKTMRYDFYTELIKVIEQHKNKENK